MVSCCIAQNHIIYDSLIVLFRDKPRNQILVFVNSVGAVTMMFKATSGSKTWTVKWLPAIVVERGRREDKICKNRERGDGGNEFHAIPIFYRENIPTNISKYHQYTKPCFVSMHHSLFILSVKTKTKQRRCFFSLRNKFNLYSVGLRWCNADIL